MQGDFCIGRWLIQPRLNTIVGSSKSTRVEPKVIQVLEGLARHAGEVVSRETWIQEVWGDAFVTDHVLTRSIAELRRIFEDDVKEPHVIQTISKQGYRLVVPVGPAAEEDVVAPHSQRIPSWMKWALFPSVTLASLLLLAGPVRPWLPGTPTSSRVQRFTISLAQHEWLGDASGSISFAISPDGDHLVYAAGPPGSQQLYLRSLDSFDPVPIPGTEGVSNPFFSPDGEWVAFAAKGKLQKVSLSGKNCQNICDIDPIFGMDGGVWDEAGTIVFATGGSLYRVSNSGGPAALVATPKTESQWYELPIILPGGKNVLFTSSRSLAQTGVTIVSNSRLSRPHRSEWPSRLLTSELAVVSLSGGEPKTLIPNAHSGVYVPTGHLVYARVDTAGKPVSARDLYAGPERLYAVPLNAQELRIMGPPVPLLEGVGRFAFSRDGTLAYVTGGQFSYRLVWCDRNGRVDPLPLPPDDYHHPVISSDGSRIAVTLSEDIWIYDLRTGNLSRLTFDGPSYWPIWTADGERVIYVSQRDPHGLKLSWKRADGTEKEEHLTAGENILSPMFCSRDGKSLVFWNNRGNSDLLLLPLGGEPKPLLATEANENDAALSPDGRWMAYRSDESGRMQVYVSDFPGLTGKWQVSTDGGREPLWSRDGKELFFRVGVRMGASASEAKLMAVEVRPGAGFQFGRARLLFEGSFRGGGRANYDITPDGKRFLMVQAVERTSPLELRIVLNWFEELRSRTNRQPASAEF